MLDYYKEVPKHFVKRSYYSVPESSEITRYRRKRRLAIKMSSARGRGVCLGVHTYTHAHAGDLLTAEQLSEFPGSSH